MPGFRNLPRVPSSSAERAVLHAAPFSWLARQWRVLRTWPREGDIHDGVQQGNPRSAAASSPSWFAGVCRGDPRGRLAAPPGKGRPMTAGEPRRTRTATTRELDSGRGFVVVASRLPVDRARGADGGTAWRPSPGGLVAALEPVMRKADGVWVGWTGDAGPEPGAFQAGGLRLVGVGLSAEQVRGHYEGFCNATLWPLYHDVIAQPAFDREWWECYQAVNRRFAR